MSTAKVRRQYEKFPYPARDPATEDKDSKVCDIDNLDALNHYCFRGKRDFRRGFRALVAGGGTGDSTIFLARQLAETDASIVHLDLSEASIDVARRRASRRNLTDRITFVRGSLLDLPSLDLGKFDYINCSGVLHHLGDPPQGLRALCSVLDPDGAMGLVLYGRYGRAGIYQAQQLLRTVLGDESDVGTRLDPARKLLTSLPPTNWLRRGPHHLPPTEEMDDAEFVDMFLHPQDRPYSVPELYGLLDAAGLRLIEFVRTYRLLYRPEYAVAPGEIRQRIQRLPLRARQAAGELLWGTVPLHNVWVSRLPDTVADPMDPDNVPFVLPDSQRAGLLDGVADRTAANLELKATLPAAVTLTVRVRLTDLARCFLARIDGRRTMGEIVSHIVREAAGHLSKEDARGACTELLETLGTLDVVLLHHKSVRPCRARSG